MVPSKSDLAPLHWGGLKWSAKNVAAKDQKKTKKKLDVEEILISITSKMESFML